MNNISSSILFALALLFSPTILAQHTYESDDFTIDFPGVEVNEMSEVIPTEIGEIKITYHIYEKSKEEAYMVSENQYDKDSIAGIDPWVLIENGRDGALNSFGISETDKEEKGDVDGFPSLEFKASNESNYVIYKIVLVENTLFQILILSTNGYPKKSEIKKFINSFELHITEE